MIIMKSKEKEKFTPFESRKKITLRSILFLSFFINRID